MAVFRNTVRINDELKVTKTSLVFGALSIIRVKTLPPDSFGRNGDLVIVDDTTESVEQLANKRVPSSVRFCQRVAIPVSGGTFTIDDGTTIFAITISNIDDVVEQVNRANIPSFRASIKNRGLIVFEGIPVTFANGTSDFPSAVGIAGAFAGGSLEVATGKWESFVTSAAGGLSYGAVSGGDGGTATAIVSGDSITYDGSGINIVATNAGLGLDTVDFDLDIADLTAGFGPLILSDEIAVNDGGTTLRFTFTDVVEDLDIPNAITTNGIITRTAANTYTSRSIIASTTAGLEGGDVVNGDGVAGDPEIGVDIDNLTSSAVDLAATDELIVFDGTNNLSYTGQQIADGVDTILGLGSGNAYGAIAGDVGTATATTSTELITFGGTGITVTATNVGVGVDTVDFDLDISDLTAGVGPLVGGDEIAVNDGGTTLRFTITDLLEDLDIPNSITTNGFVVRTAADTYTSRSIAIEGAGDGDGLIITNGDGVAGNPILGLDIEGLPARSDAVDGSDRVAVWNTTVDANEYYLVSEIAAALAGVDSFNTWARSGNGSGASVVADSATDTVTLDGGIGIFLTFTPASDTVSFAFSRSGMADTIVTSADTIPFFDATNSNEPEFRSFSDIFADLDVPNGITTNGIIVRTAADTYASRTIDASTDEDELGIIITDGDGVSGDPQIGLDIDGTTSSPAEMASTDEFLVHDKSEGTAGANRSMTGTQIADGVSTILGRDALTLSTIGGQPIFTFSDATRGPKTLSVETVTFMWAENKVGNDDWIRIGTSDHAVVGYVIPHPATIIKVTAMTEDNNGNLKDIDLYIDDVLSTTGIVSFTGGAGEDAFTDVTLNIDIAAGEKIQLRGDTAGGSIEDTTITLFVKWRV